MSKAKILNLTIEKAKEISQAINENTIFNRSKSQEEKISTDIFIKRFGISRKDFSETIKNTSIRYNRSTFQYVFDDTKNPNNKGDTLVSPDKTIYNQDLISRNKVQFNKTNRQHNKSETIVANGETIKTNKAIVEFEDMKSGLVEMLEWYKDQRKKENIIDIEMPILYIDKEKLTEQAVTRGFKIYPNVMAEFKEFCKRNSQYNMQDLMAMALIEYMKNYK